jgi:hypothetical protein
MKTTLELPDKLMRAVKVLAAETDRKLKDVVAELIKRGLQTGAPDNDDDPLQAWARKLHFGKDGSVRNPDGIADPEFFDSLRDIREQSRARPTRDPLADAD